MKSEAENYFYTEVYGNSIIDYKDENIKKAIIEAFKNGYKKAKEIYG